MVPWAVINDIDLAAVYGFKHMAASVLGMI